MATVFEVKVKDKRGKTFFKTVKGDNANAVKQKLRESNLTVVGIKEKGIGPTSRGGLSGIAKIFSKETLTKLTYL